MLQLLCSLKYDPKYKAGGLEQFQSQFTSLHLHMYCIFTCVRPATFVQLPGNQGRCRCTSSHIRATSRQPRLVQVYVQAHSCHFQATKAGAGVRPATFVPLPGNQGRCRCTSSRIRATSRQPRPVQVYVQPHSCHFQAAKAGAGVRPGTFVSLPGNQGRCRCTSSRIRATSRQPRPVQVYVQPHSCHFQAAKAGAGVRPAVFVPLPGNQGWCRCTSSHIRVTSRQPRPVQVYVQPHSCHFQATKAGAGVRPATFVSLSGNQGRCRCASSHIRVTSRQPRPVQVYVQPHSCHFQATKAGAGVRPATFVPLPGNQGRCRCTSSHIRVTSRQPRPVQVYVQPHSCHFQATKAGAG